MNSVKTVSVDIEKQRKDLEQMVNQGTVPNDGVNRRLDDIYIALQDLSLSQPLTDMVEHIKTAVDTIHDGELT